MPLSDVSSESSRPGSTATTPVMPAPARARWFRGQPILEWAETSRCGTYHAVNQDAVRVEPPHFFGVADGVGGGAHGEVASQAALAHCAGLDKSRRNDPDALRAHVRKADAVVRQAIAEVSDGAGATTLVGVWLTGWRGFIVHVGDARASRLRFRGGKARLEALTRDQTYGEMGETPPTGGSAGDPARMIGVGAVGDPPATRLRLGRGDILLLSSDGLHRYAEPWEIEAAAEEWRAEGAPLRALANRLESLALGRGSPDDISMLLVRRNAWPGLPWLAWTGMLAALLAVAVGMWGWATYFSGRGFAGYSVLPEVREVPEQVFCPPPCPLVVARSASNEGVGGIPPVSASVCPANELVVPVLVPVGPRSAVAGECRSVVLRGE
ncbi:PP2C family protein-serine/threonine phosphatase [Methylomagnum sp.]